MAAANLFECLADEVERPFLVQAFGRALTDEERERYAEALAGRDPARAEWLRLERALHSRAADDPATWRRFDALCEALAGDWIRLLRRDSLLNCGQGPAEPRRVRFARVCDRRWESLAPTEDARVRACEACEQRVYHCESVGEAEAHAREGHCIAVSGELVAAAGGDTRNMLGRPDPVARWAERLFGAD